MKAKSVFSCFALLAVLLMTAACSSEDDLITAGDEVNLTFTATLDQYIDSRAISDGSMVDKLIFIAYDEDGNEIAGLRQENVPVTGGRATVNTRVVKGHRYTFAFWAQNSNCTAYSFTSDHKSLNVNYNGYANDESRDAFYATCTDFAVEPVTEPFEMDVLLHRPFAQLNFGTTAQDMEEANKYAPATGSHIKIQGGVCTSLNLLSGIAGDQQPVELEAGPFPAEALRVNGEEYFYLSMNYLLANNDRSEITGITMTTVMNRLDNDASYAITYESLPVQRNFRTNVVGWLITRKADFKVVIDSSFDGDLTYDYGASVWNGSDIEEPELKNGTYTITEASQLAWFQDYAPVNGSTIRIANALNFNELELKPLLCGASNITVVADDDCAIRGIKVSGTGSAALFGDAAGLTVRNLTIDRMTVTAAPDAQGNAVAGAIVARASGSTTLENVTVEGSSVNGNCMVGGLVGTVTAGGHLVATGCRVASSTIENTDGGSRQGLAGGIVGYIASGATAQHVFTSCEVYNTVVKARMSDDASLTSGKLLGALEGNADSDELRINNCTVMVNFLGLDPQAEAQQSPYGADQLIGGNQQGKGHVYINNVELPLNN